MVMQPGELVTRRYRVESLLGRGGLGAAYAVRDRARDQRVCLKLLADRGLAHALRHEFESLRTISHPNLARVRDFGVALIEGASVPFFTSDLVEGRAFDVAVRDLSFTSLSDAVAGVLSALAALHAAGVRHGDIKPENILVSPEGRAVVIDLSCAAKVGQAVSPAGTLAFMAPEVQRGDAADGRSDLFSLGRCLQTVLVGRDAPAWAPPLVKRMVAERASERPLSAVEVLEHLAPHAALPRAIHAVPRALIGRRDLSLRGAAAIRAVAEGKPGPRVIDLVGANGAGKTRLLRELVWVAQQVAATVEACGDGASVVRRALAIASDREELPPGLLAAVAAHEDIVGDARPVVLVVDDVDQLEGEQRQLLDAMERLIAPTDPILLIRATTESAKSSEVLALAPLSETEVREWATAVGFSELSMRIHEASRGHPADIDAAVKALEHGVPAVDLESAVATAAGAVVPTPSRQAELSLALLASARAPIEPDALARLDPSASTSIIDELVGLGLVRHGESGLVLARPALEEGVTRVVAAETLREAHLRLGERAEAALDGGAQQSRSSEQAAAAVRHFALAGLRERAVLLFERCLPLVEAAPRAWRGAVEPLLVTGQRGEIGLIVARALLAAGDARAARDLLPQVDDVETSLLAAECEIELGESAVARERLTHLAPRDPVSEARRAALLSRALSRLGAFGDPHHAKLRGYLEQALPASVRADLLECAGVAAMYAGDLEQAKAWLREAEALLGTFAPPRRRVRAAAHRG
ncbi:MAG: protein kinase, partial [Myxococcales bacterium]|nr:protein kinase [Myxococcales bacterium]